MKQRSVLFSALHSLIRDQVPATVRVKHDH